MDIKEIRGFVPALGTPLDGNGNLLKESYMAQCRKMIEKGAVALLSMGSMGQQAFIREEVCVQVAQAAVEAADVVLMDDDLLKIPEAIRISRKCMRIVYENICFSIGIKVLCLGLSAVGIANMWMAVFADVGVMILAVLNALRALNSRRTRG